MTLSVEQERRRTPRQSERSRLDPFVVIGGDASPRDQRDLMERPFLLAVEIATHQTDPLPCQ